MEHLIETYITDLTYLYLFSFISFLYAIITYLTQLVVSLFVFYDIEISERGKKNS